MVEVGDGPDLAEIVLAFTEDAGADVVIDTVGPPLWPASLRCLGQFGRIALLGDVTGEPTAVRLAEVIFRDPAADRGIRSIAADTGAVR